MTGTPGAYVVEFEGDLGNAPQALLDTDISNLIGTNPSVAVAETQLGVLPTSGNTTTSITFAPALGPGTYSTTAALTFKPQQINIKIGEGNLTYTEHRDYQLPLGPRLAGYRPRAEGCPDGREAGRRVRAHHQRHRRERSARWRRSRASTARRSGLAPRPTCANRTASTWWWSTTRPARQSNRETNVFPMFRAETREINYNAATIVLTGKCKASEPVTYRGTACDNV